MFKKLFIGAILLIMPTLSFSAVTDDADGNFDSTSYVETDSTTTSSSTVTSTNTNTNTNTNDTTIDSTTTSTSTNTSTNTNTNTNTSTSTVDTTSTNTSTNTNTNTSTNTSTNTNTNTNTNTSTSTSTTDSTIDQTVDQTINSTNTNTNTNNNTNTNTSTNTNNNTSTSTNTNTNNNVNNSTSTNSNTNNNNNKSDITQTIKSPPPSAIAPTVNAGGNDTCTVSATGAVQTQILGISGGGHIRDLNCERLKNAKTLYNMGMKVAAVSLMCTEPNVFKAMEMAGTPCPFEGKIGKEAQALWEENPELRPDVKEEEVRRNDTAKGILLGILGVLTLGTLF